jgi:hypothetical protein
MRAVSIATFYVEIEREGDGPHPNANLENEQYLDMVNMLFMSAQQFHPVCNCIVLTNECTRLGPVSSYCSRINYAVRHDKMMLDRMGAQRAFFLNYDFSCPVVMADSDVLINDSLDSVFQQDFDIGLTWRNNARMPINGGIMFVNNRRPSASRRFFTAVHEIYERKYADQAEWYGDQYALRDFLGMTRKEIVNHRGVVETNGCRVLLLPCEQYNYSPDNVMTSITSRFLDKLVLHFKGERKELMKLYWQAHLMTLKSWNPYAWLCAWQARRAIEEGVINEQNRMSSVS